MDSTTGATPHSPSSVPGGATGRVPARQALPSLAGLIDVLDRVDGPAVGPARRRLPTHRSAAPGVGSRTSGTRPIAFRATAARSRPLRSVQPAPAARRPAAAPVIEPGSYWDMSHAPVPAAPVGSEPERSRAAARMTGLIRRAAMWGAGAEGEHLAWRTAMATRVPAPSAPEAAPPVQRLRRMLRRMALWGAGDDGEYLAWGAALTPAPVRRLDPPVVLREMPSTPVIQPAATSPAAALVPSGPAAAGRRPIGPVLPRTARIDPVGWCAPAGSGSAAPTRWPAAPSGWPQPPQWPPVQPTAAVKKTPTPTSTPTTAMPTTAMPTAMRPAFSPRRAPSACPMGATGTSAARSPLAWPRERGLARARGDPVSTQARGSPAPPRPSSRIPSAASIRSPAPASLPPPRPAQTVPG